MTRRIAATAAALWAALLLAGLLLSPDRALFLAFDDTFYYLEIAWRIAAGEGSTFDGLQPTNGYHPLWMLICVLLAPIGQQGIDGVVLLLALQLVIWTGGTVALLRAGANPRGAWSGQLAALLLLANPYAMKLVVNGMETALVYAIDAALLAVLVHAGSRLWQAPEQRLRLGVGALLALAFLARTDAGFLSACVAAWVGLRSLPQGPRATLRNLIPLCLPPALALLAFLSINQLLFGQMMQVSGELKRTTPSPTEWVLVVLLLAGAAALVLRPAPPRQGALWARLDPTRPFAAFLLVHLAWYLGFQEYPRQWYFAPQLAWLALLLTGALPALAARAASEDPQRPRRAAALAMGPVLLALTGAMGVGLWRANSPGFLPARLADREAARWANANLPADSVVGTWDAGVIGWYCDRPVVNLDGVVASHAFLAALRRQDSAAFLAGLGLSHVINHHPSAAPGDVAALREALSTRVGPVPAAAATVLWTTPFTMTASTNGADHGVHQMATTVLDLGPTR